MLEPSAEADKTTLLRRVSLDITGLPPSEKTAQQSTTVGVREGGVMGKTKSAIFEAVHDTAKGLRQEGGMDEITLRELDPR